MSMEHTTGKEVYTAVIGGAAGDGAREAGLHLASFLHAIGFETFFSFEYPSLIRGGHNQTRISFSKERVYNDHKAIDILIAVNEESVRLHLSELKESAVIIAESTYAESLRDIERPILFVPMKELAEEANVPQVARTSAAFGSLCRLMGIPIERMEELVKEVFADVGAEKNIALAVKGYQHAEERGVQTLPWPEMENIGSSAPARGELLDGNKATAKGFLAAGLEQYVAYPMTPSTSILHFLAKVQHEANIKVIHPEDEISVINMALGIAYTGKRVALGTAAGGFALMQEAFSFAGITELPLALAVSSRRGPATGVATHTGQSDLRFIIHAGHGEFPRVVIAPGDAEEAFYAGMNALNIAWKYQVPAIVLLDKHISESVSVAEVDQGSVRVELGKRKEWLGEGEAYKRYELTDDGISPMMFPGTQHAAVKITSYEHDEYGIATDEASMVQTMNDKRARKLRGVLSDLSGIEAVKVYGDMESKDVVVFWGSTKGSVLEAAKYVNKPLKLVQVVCVEPLDRDRISSLFADAERIIDIEANSDAQLAGIIREKTGIAMTDTILRYDSMVFEPMELAGQLNALLA